jgi:hypothetical protein
MTSAPVWMIVALVLILQVGLPTVSSGAAVRIDGCIPVSAADVAKAPATTPGRGHERGPSCRHDEACPVRLAAGETLCSAAPRPYLDSPTATNPTSHAHTATLEVRRATTGALPASTPSLPRHTAAKAEKKVVIGEDMEGRVIPQAKRLGAEHYDPPDLPRSQWMEHNRQWIRDRMDEGCTIIDCGSAPGRAKYPKPTSPYYEMELREIAKRKYPLQRSPWWGE